MAKKLIYLLPTFSHFPFVVNCLLSEGYFCNIRSHVSPSTDNKKPSSELPSRIVAVSSPSLIDPNIPHRRLHFCPSSFLLIPLFAPPPPVSLLLGASFATTFLDRHWMRAVLGAHKTTLTPKPVVLTGVCSLFLSRVRLDIPI